MLGTKTKNFASSALASTVIRLFGRGTNLAVHWWYQITAIVVLSVVLGLNWPVCSIPGSSYVSMLVSPGRRCYKCQLLDVRLNP